jgi:hypothetical protein
MDIASFSEWVTREWHVIRAAPGTLIVVAGLSATVAWWLRGVLLAGKLEGLEAQNSALKERIQFAAERLSEASEERARLRQELNSIDNHADEKMPVYAITRPAQAARTALDRLDQIEDDAAASLSNRKPPA